MYLHCHKCGWEQDDFWSESYNPIKSLDFWEEDLFSPEIDKKWHDSGMTLREVILKELYNTMLCINKMKFRTKQEYENAQDKSCPVCGNIRLDID